MMNRCTRYYNSSRSNAGLSLIFLVCTSVISSKMHAVAATTPRSGESHDANTGTGAAPTGTPFNVKLQFNEKSPYSGFDNSGETSDADKNPRTSSVPWLLAPWNGTNQARRVITGNLQGAGLYATVKPATIEYSVTPSPDDPNLFTVTSVPPAQEDPSSPAADVDGQIQFDAANSPPAKPVGNAGVLRSYVRPQRTISVHFYFVTVNLAGRAIQCGRNPSELADFVAALNNIWLPQANVYFQWKNNSYNNITYTPPDPTHVDIDSLSDTFRDWSTRTPGCWNIYFVGHFRSSTGAEAASTSSSFNEYDPTQVVHQLTVYKSATALPLFTNESIDQYHVVLAHEAGHAIGAIGSGYPLDHSSDPANLMYYSVTSRWLRHYQVIFLNNSAMRKQKFN